MPPLTKADIPNLVKVAILRTTGDNHPDPTTVDAKASMSDYNFSFFDYSRLTARFDHIVKMYKVGAGVSENDVENCNTVQECIDMVTKATN